MAHRRFLPSRSFFRWSHLFMAIIRLTDEKYWSRWVYGQLLYKGPSNPSEASTGMSQVESLCLSPPPLLCHLHYPASLCSSSCPWAQVGKPLQKAKTLGSHHCHWHCPSDFTHDHTKLSIPCFPTSAAGLASFFRIWKSQLLILYCPGWTITLTCTWYVYVLVNNCQAVLPKVFALYQ